MNKTSGNTTPSGEVPFFIVGSGRSGTTLLRSLLSAHSEIAIPPETHFMKRAYREGAATQASPADFEVFWRDLVAWSRFRDIEVDPARVLARVDMAGVRDFRSVFLAILAVYGESQGKQHVGEKTPGHYRYLDKLFEWFPDTRILVLRRDPRDVVASHLTSPWVTDQMRPGRLRAPLLRRLRLFHVAERALLWRQAHGVFLADTAADPRMHVVFYERLVSDPEGELARICAFLGHAYETRMLAPRGQSEAVSSITEAPASGWQGWITDHQTKANAGVSTRSVGRWCKALAPAEAALVESICAPVMERHGYRPEMPRTPRRLLGHALLRAGMFEDTLRRTPQAYHAGLKPK